MQDVGRPHETARGGVDRPSGRVEACHRAGMLFIVVSDAGGKQLQKPLYSLFGQVTAGLDVVQKIEADGSPQGQPKTLHQMVKVTITEA